MIDFVKSLVGGALIRGAEYGGQRDRQIDRTIFLRYAESRGRTRYPVGAKTSGMWALASPALQSRVVDCSRKDAKRCCGTHGMLHKSAL